MNDTILGDADEYRHRNYIIHIRIWSIPLVKKEVKIMTKNILIREVKEKLHLYNYQIANILKVSESTFTRMMREELPEEEQRRIVALIREAHNAGE